MDPDLQQRIAAVKTECGEILRLSEKATAGPWETNFAHVMRRTAGVNHVICRATSFAHDSDASFIAHSRNVSPAMARVVLAALECLERQVNEPDWHSHMCDNDGRGCPACELAEQFLESIANQWEGKL